jgi:hypothetical protein
LSIVNPRVFFDGKTHLDNGAPWEYHFGMSSVSFNPQDWLRFVHLSPFLRAWAKLGLGDDDLRALEVAIMERPTRPPVIPGTEGLRKIRFAGLKSDKGKRGSERVLYVYLPIQGIVLLITTFAKNEADNLTEAEKKAINRLIREIKAELETGA